jgi:hypothetical protein
MTLKIVVIAVVAGALVALSPIAPTVAERFQTLLDPQQFIEVWVERIISGAQTSIANPVGVGLGYTAGVPSFLKSDLFKDLPVQNMDSGYGAAALELGIIGSLIFLFFCIKIGIESVKAWRAIPSRRTKDLLLGPVLWMASYPLWSVIAPPQATLPSSIFFWLLLGIIVKARTLPPDTCESPSRFRVAQPTTATAGTWSKSPRGWRPAPASRSGRPHFRTG